MISEYSAKNSILAPCVTLSKTRWLISHGIPIHYLPFSLFISVCHLKRPPRIPMFEHLVPNGGTVWEGCRTFRKESTERESGSQVGNSDAFYRSPDPLPSHSLLPEHKHVINLLLAPATMLSLLLCPSGTINKSCLPEVASVRIFFGGSRGVTVFTGSINGERNTLPIITPGASSQTWKPPFRKAGQDI